MATAIRDRAVTQARRLGVALLEDPLGKERTAFGPETRPELWLDGLLPPVVETLEQQSPAAVGEPPRAGRGKHALR